MRKRTMMVFVLIAMMLGTVMSFPVFAAEKTPNINCGHIDIFVNEDMGIIIETREVAKNGKTLVGFTEVKTDYAQVFNGIQAEPEQQVSKTFSHNILDRNGELLATVYSTVKGIYSQVDSWAKILDISASDSGPYASNFSFNKSISGADGYLHIYFNGASAGTMHYRIYTNGTISKRAW